MGVYNVEKCKQQQQQHQQDNAIITHKHVHSEHLFLPEHLQMAKGMMDLCDLERQETFDH